MRHLEWIATWCMGTYIVPNTVDPLVGKSEDSYWACDGNQWNQRTLWGELRVNCNLVPRSPLGMRESKPLEKTKTHVLVFMDSYRIIWGISLIKERFIETMTSSGWPDEDMQDSTCCLSRNIARKAWQWSKQFANDRRTPQILHLAMTTYALYRTLVLWGQ